MKLNRLSTIAMSLCLVGLTTSPSSLFAMHVKKLSDKQEIKKTIEAEGAYKNLSKLVKNEEELTMTFQYNFEQLLKDGNRLSINYEKDGSDYQSYLEFFSGKKVQDGTLLGATIKFKDLTTLTNVHDSLMEIMNNEKYMILVAPTFYMAGDLQEESSHILWEKAQRQFFLVCDGKKYMKMTDYINRWTQL